MSPGIGPGMLEKGDPREVSGEIQVLLDDIEELLNETVLNYAVGGREWTMPQGTADET
ncbi:hypothetical protein ABZ642_05455 [Streptomyces sp. NPDC007157]|uniref:hypothetical protein n=1 Tax=Streptomyces sp. NPDC007157 TaxID=3154681 RepID=UPI0033F352F5